MYQLSLQILAILAPSAILALIGLAWFKAGVDYPIKFVTKLVINVGMPALLFHTLATSEVEIASLGRMALAALVVHLVFTPFIIVLLRMADKDWRLSIAHVVGNTGNLGLPVCYFAFGDIGLAYAMAFFALQCLLLFGLGDAVLAGSASPMRALKSPILHAVWIGIAVRLSGVAIPDFVFDTVELLGQLVIPIMLITLGVSLAGMKVTQLPSNLLWSTIRTLMAIAVGFGVAWLFGFEGAARGVLIIETAAPVAVFNFLMAIRHNRDSTEVSGLILVTHLAAIVYLPLLLAVLL